MAKKPNVDVRKLKDEVTEFLKKSKFEKAADVLEQLVAAEPKDMAQRLKLGDTYRRLEQVQKAIANYQHAAKFFADEGQLIKAIGAVKIILEIDPDNQDAQKQLQDMNERRFGKVTLETAGLKPKPGIGAGARATSAIELEEADQAAQNVGNAIQPLELPDEDEPLELDDGKPSKPAPRKPAPPPRVIAPPPPPAASRQKSYDLSGSDELDLDLASPISEEIQLRKSKAKLAASARPPPPPKEREIELDLDAEPEELPEDAIIHPEAEDLAVSPDDEEITLDEEIRPAAAPPPSIPLPQKRPQASAFKPQARAPQPPPPPGQGGSMRIADRLSSG
ncbi:MAG: hypothetical protein LC689_08350 [Myxococcales bacterium]|nr:hypothetical protein [Myxococcales bacterium]